MNTDYVDGRRERWEGLTEDEARRMMSERIGDPAVERVEVLKGEGMTRAERRKQQHEMKVYRRAANRR